MPKKLKFEVFLEEYQQASELPEDSQTLITLARDNCVYAYAPYSHFQVGAAVLLADGTMLTGTNQENNAFPSGLCAERVALFSAASRFPDIPIKKIAITAKKQHETAHQAVRPCGGCLQVMAEYQSRQNEPIELLMESHAGTIQVANSVNMLLPFEFAYQRPV